MSVSRNQFPLTWSAAHLHLSQDSMNILKLSSGVTSSIHPLRCRLVPLCFILRWTVASSFLVWMLLWVQEHAGQLCSCSIWRVLYVLALFLVFWIHFKRAGWTSTPLVTITLCCTTAASSLLLRFYFVVLVYSCISLSLAVTCDSCTVISSARAHCCMKPWRAKGKTGNAKIRWIYQEKNYFTHQNRKQCRADLPTFLLDQQGTTAFPSR